MKKLILMVIVLVAQCVFFSGCGGGGGNAATSETSGKWVYNDAYTSLEVDINSPDNVNYTGTIKQTWYTAPMTASGPATSTTFTPIITTADISGKYLPMSSYVPYKGTPTAIITNISGPAINLSLYYGPESLSPNPAMQYPNRFACEIIPSSVFSYAGTTGNDSGNLDYDGFMYMTKM